MIILLMDFNVYPNRPDHHVAEYPVPEGSNCLLVTHERRIEAGEVFQQPIVSKLPYLVSTRRGIDTLTDYSGFMIDHERLIGTRVSVSLCDSSSLTMRTGWRRGLR